MKRSFVLAMAIMVCLAIVPAALYAKENAKDKDDAADKTAELRKRTEEKKTELNGSEWQVSVAPTGGGAGSKDVGKIDILTFQNGQFRSKIFAKLGFSPTNYTITVSEMEEGPTVWESMQTSGEGTITFWRGEWKDEVMTGAISRQVEDGNEEYYFTTSEYKKIPPTSEPEEKAEEIKEEAPALLSSEPLPEKPAPVTTKKAKKSWFSS